MNNNIDLENKTIHNFKILINNEDCVTKSYIDEKIVNKDDVVTKKYVDDTFKEFIEILERYFNEVRFDSNNSSFKINKLCFDLNFLYKKI